MDSNVETPATNEMRKKVDKPVSVRVVGQQDGKAIVQWLEDDNLKRALVSQSAIKPGDKGDELVVAKDKLKTAYGDDLEAPITGLPSAKRIAKRLNRVGIWTYADVVAKQDEALGAFRAAFNDAFLAFVSECRNKEKSK